jgi:hypothetical protein
MRTVRFVFSILATLIIFAATPALAQAPGAALNVTADDYAKRITDLTASGAEVVGTKISIWFPSGLLTDAERKALVDRLDRGITVLRELVGTHEWQALSPDQKIVMYIALDKFPSHAIGRGVVFMSAIDIKEGNGPFLHEVAHEFLGFRIAGLPADPETRHKSDRLVPIGSKRGFPNTSLRRPAARLASKTVTFSRSGVLRSQIDPALKEQRAQQGNKYWST